MTNPPECFSRDPAEPIAIFQARESRFNLLLIDTDARHDPRTDEQLLQQMGRNESDNAGLRAGSAQFGNDVGIEQSPVYR